MPSSSRVTRFFGKNSANTNKCLTNQRLNLRTIALTHKLAEPLECPDGDHNRADSQMSRVHCSWVEQRVAALPPGGLVWFPELNALRIPACRKVSFCLKAHNQPPLFHQKV